ncbi:MAG: aminopeptidase [Spirochaetes bacterium]|nr:aminopeptidase [Spirochaetota bacterium]
MFNVMLFYNEENDLVLKDYENSILKIKQICEETEYSGDIYLTYLHDISKKIINTYEYEKKLSDDYIYSNDFQFLLKNNNEFYNEIYNFNYNSSYANPEHSSFIFDETTGPLFSYFFSKFLFINPDIAKHKLFKLFELNKIFIEAYDYIKNNRFDYYEIKNIMIKVDSKKDKTKDFFFDFVEQYNENYRFYTDIIEFSLLNDLRYLFKYGTYISDIEIKTAKFLLNYPINKLKNIASSVFNAYIEGFKRNNIKTDKRKTVNFMLNIGQENIYKYLFEIFYKNNFQITVKDINTSVINHQYFYDHKFDSTLFLDEQYLTNSVNGFKNALVLNEEILKNISGIIYFEKFGEEPYNPINKKSNLRLNNDQVKIHAKIKSEMIRLFNQYVPRNETSYCIVAFPTPEIGKHFKDIFEETYLINTLDNDKYQKINQVIIDALDKASIIHIKGNNNNETDIIISLNELNNPEKESNFVNSIAGVNIPLGEVFTSPKLFGTNGILHVKNSYLDDYNYIDLKLIFKDGYIEEYSCNNYENIDDNIKYIKDNLLFPHDTLPLGEFAIGTNTLAYKMCKQYNIINKLPVLIIEKMGPHFAIGDTCFKQKEDYKMYNLINNKEIVAKDNEKSILRKTDIANAYTDVHIDITLPYNEIDFIKAITKENREIIIIKDGKFVLEGTQELNIYL